MKEVSQILLLQRIRNRIIETLTSYTHESTWDLFGADEMVNIWEDWVDEQRLESYIAPVFSQSEQAALHQFHQDWLDYCDNTPFQLPKDFKENEQWQQLLNSAQKALNTFNAIGTFDEERELF